MPTHPIAPEPDHMCGARGYETLSQGYVGATANATRAASRSNRTYRALEQLRLI
jgi:hypothetical protein